MRLRHASFAAAVLAASLAALLAATPAPSRAQTAVTPAADPRALLDAPTEALRANKRLVLDFWREVLEAGHLEKADRYLSEGYIQHNPNVPGGRAGFVKFFGRFAGPRPVAEAVQAPLVAVTAEGDLVVVATVQTRPVPGAAGRTFTTTWFDMFRVADGKIVEHWDCAPLQAPPAP